MPRVQKEPTSTRRARTQVQEAPLSPLSTVAIDDFTATEVDADADFDAAFLRDYSYDESYRFRERRQHTDKQREEFLERVRNTPSVARAWSKGTRHNVYSMDKKWKAYVSCYF